MPDGARTVEGNIEGRREVGRVQEAAAKSDNEFTTIVDVCQRDVAVGDDVSSTELSRSGTFVGGGRAVIGALFKVRRRAEDSTTESEIRRNRERVEGGGVRGLRDVVATYDIDERSERVSDVIGRVFSR